MARLETSDARTAVLRAVMDDDSFIGATFSGRRRSGRPEFEKLTLRPMLMRGAPHVQVTCFKGKQVVHRNVARPELSSLVEELLAMPYGQVHVRSAAGDVHVRHGKKDRVFVSRGKPSYEAPPVESHDHEKQYLLPPDPADPLLRELGMLGGDGRLRTSMRAKFKQVNEFLRILDQVVPDADDLHLVDCGCGSAWLSFAAVHYLQTTRGKTVRMSGVDANPELVQKAQELSTRLGWDDRVRFSTGFIRDFTPKGGVDMVLSLHACDTATDEAIAQGIAWEADSILVAPCCQHDLQEQLSLDVLRPVLRYGILRERTADILTDSFRALALQVHGYRTGVMEFVSSAHTARNIMIRAERAPEDGAAIERAAGEYTDLRSFCGVEPAIERLLGDAFQDALSKAADA